MPATRPSHYASPTASDTQKNIIILIIFANGLVAGSSQANHLARALLHRALHDHHHRCPSQFVDDLKMFSEGTTRQVVFRFSQPAVELFHSLGKLKVDLSFSGWRDQGFGISPTRHARDLGVDVSFGGRSVSIARKRARRAFVRARRIRSFAKKHTRASRLLFKGGALPQCTYGHQIWGIPPTSMKRLRAAAAWTRAGMFTTTLLAITKTEPASRLHAEVITEYLCIFARQSFANQEN